MKLRARNQFDGVASKDSEGAVNAIVTIDVNGPTVSATLPMMSIKALLGKATYVISRPPGSG